MPRKKSNFHGWNRIVAKSKPHAKDLRRGRFSETGHYYLVSTVTRNRIQIFTSLACARAVVQAMHAMDEMGQCETLAWVLMPDHLHWLFVLQNARLPDLVGQMKQAAASKINRLYDQLGPPVWQPGFHDRLLRQEEDIVDIARYIVANPLRAGLVVRVGDYPYWDAVWL